MNNITGNKPNNASSKVGGVKSLLREFKLLIFLLSIVAVCYVIGTMENEKEVVTTSSVPCADIYECSARNKMHGGDSVSDGNTSSSEIATYCDTQTSYCRVNVAIPRGSKCYCYENNLQLSGVAR